MVDKTTQNIELIGVVLLFATIRFSGYWLYLRWLIAHGRPAKSPAAVVAATRMFAGLIAGALLTALAVHASGETLKQALIWVPGQFMLRLAIWSGVLRVFFGRVDVRSLVPGMVLSYLLDIPSAVVTVLGIFVSMQGARFC